MTKYIEKRINVKKEAEIISKNLFRIHSKQKVIYVRLSERRTELDSARLYLGMVSCAARVWSGNTAWNRVFAELGRIFSFLTPPAARKYRLKSIFR